MTARPSGGAPPQSRPASKRSWLGLFVLATVAFAILVALGTWQLQRKTWKEGLIASLTERLAAAPQPLPPAAEWRTLDRAHDEYRRVRFTGSFDNAREALVFAAPNGFRPDVTEPGDWVFTLARIASSSTGEQRAPGNIVIVNRGFVPDARRDPGSRREGQITEPIEITGVLRWPDERHWFTPADEPEHNLWFTRDPTHMAEAKGLDPRTVAPFYVEQESPVPPGGLPRPGKLVVALPDNHLQYAITWYGLAAVLAASFGVWTFTSRRRSATDMA